MRKVRSAWFGKTRPVGGILGFGSAISVEAYVSQDLIVAAAMLIMLYVYVKSLQAVKDHSESSSLPIVPSHESRSRQHYLYLSHDLCRSRQNDSYLTSAMCH